MKFLVRLTGKIYLMLLGYTSRLKEVNKEYVLPFWEEKKNVIYALWHSRLFFLTAYARYRLKKIDVAVIISQSRDGEYIAEVVKGIGFLPVRGSSSASGARAFARLLALGKNGFDLAITPDGPRGPREIVKAGIIELARKSGLTIIPASYSSRWRKVLNSWDSFMLPLPFSKTVVIFGKPIEVKPDATEIEKEEIRLKLAETLKEITRQADEMVKI